MNKKCIFEYYHELTSELRVLSPISKITSSLEIFCIKERQIPNPTEGSPYIIIKEHSYVYIQ